MRIRLSAVVASVLTVVVVVSTTLAGAPSQAASRLPRYVALGDSYSAASGVLPPDHTAPPGCARSTSNYPHRIAQRIRVRLVDVTCGGAETTDLFASQHPGVPPQLDALTARTDLVTMTIGGNDNGVFMGTLQKCTAAGLTTLGRGSPCRDTYGASITDTIREKTYPALVRALRAVHRRAPRAEVAILGYPWIMPRAVGCYDRMPVASGDVPYVRHVQWVLNDVVRRAAAATRSTYVDLNKVSDGHDACQPAGVRWVEPALQGTNPVVVHPNALGEARMAARVVRVLGLV